MPGKHIYRDTQLNPVDTVGNDNHSNYVSLLFYRVRATFTQSGSETRERDDKREKSRLHRAHTHTLKSYVFSFKSCPAHVVTALRASL